MRFLEGIVTAIQGNAKEKLNDPLIGSFIASFILWNWDKFLLLFFGNKEMDVRIADCIAALTMSFESWTKFFLSLCIYVVPLLVSLFYVFLMPRISIWMSVKLQPLEVGKHTAAVDLEIAQAVKQQELNKQKLLSDPNKTFLPQIVEEEIKQKVLNTEKKQAETDKAKDEAAKAKAERESAEAITNKANNENDLQQSKNEYEKKKLSVGVAITNSMMQANSYYSSLNFVRLLSESLAEDNIAITHKSLTEIIAAAFGYESYDDLLKDQTFNNEALKGLKYILLDSVSLGARLEKILAEDFIDEDVCSSDHIFDHLTMMFDSLPYLYGDEETIAEAIFEEVEANKYDLINADAVSGAIASTDSIIEEIDLILNRVDILDSGLEIFIDGHGSGSHRKDSSVPGQGIDITLNVTVPLLWGEYGLGQYTMITSSDPESFDDEWVVA